RRPRSEKPARRDSRPYRNADRTDQRRLFQGERYFPGRAHPRCHQTPDLDGRSSYFGRDGGCLRHLHSPRTDRYRQPRQRSRGRQPAVGDQQAADDRGVGAAERMREAIDNLISNAIKYSPIGGKIVVLVTHEQDNTVIRVADEGAGLSPEDLGRLFGRFQRLSAKPTAGESSTGLGLSIVKRIIDMHGGQVTAESGGPGEGSTFTVVLPATDMP